jgi:heme/copper-type cytochrome/quinol oxidase subunit 2
MTPRTWRWHIALAGGVLALLVSLHSQADQDRTEGKGQVFDIVVQQGKRVSGAGVLKVQQGEDVTLHITSDTADEFHLHGYNLLVQLRPHQTATLHFIAKLAGRFTYELHKSDLELGALEVYPR